MIRLGSLAGYPFEGPRLLAGWAPPPVAAVYAIVRKLDSGRDRYAVIYVDQSGDLPGAGFPFRHPRAGCWIARAGSRWNLYACWYEIPGDSAAQRAEIVRQLMAVYQPRCNAAAYEHAWEPAWLSRPVLGGPASPGAEHAPGPDAASRDI